jgi:hypothetical protein
MQLELCGVDLKWESVNVAGYGNQGMWLTLHGTIPQLTLYDSKTLLKDCFFPNPECGM